MEFNQLEPQIVNDLIKENCPNLTEAVESLPEPKQLGADGTRRLTTYVYGMLLNGYSYGVTCEEANKLFGINLYFEDIRTIEQMINFETRLAFMKVKF